MKKLFIFFLIFSIYFNLNYLVFAQKIQSQNKENSQEQIQEKNQEQISPQLETNKQTQLQNQSVTQEIKLKSKTQNQINQPPSIEDQTQLIGKKIINLIGNEKAGDEISQQVDNLFNQNDEIQSDVKEQLKILQSKQGIIKKLFGSDQRIVDNLKEQIQINQSKLEQLKQLKPNIKGEQTQIEVEKIIDGMDQENQEFANQIRNEEQVRGILSWVVDIGKNAVNLIKKIIKN
jgi:hypothetical protein